MFLTYSVINMFIYFIDIMDNSLYPDPRNL
jgi:hypothetical protein